MIFSQCSECGKKAEVLLDDGTTWCVECDAGAENIKHAETDVFAEAKKTEIVRHYGASIGKQMTETEYPTRSKP